MAWRFTIYDHPIFRGLRQIVELGGVFRVVAEADNAETAIALAA